MVARPLRLLIALAVSLPMLAWSQNGGDFSNNLQPVTKVPEGVLLVKGAWSSASDSLTPLPEGGAVTIKNFRELVSLNGGPKRRVSAARKPRKKRAGVA